MARLPFNNPTGLVFSGPSRLLVIVGGDPNVTAANFPMVVWNWSGGEIREQARIELPRPGRRVARTGHDAVIVAMVANLADAEWLAYLPPPRQQTCRNLS